MNKKKLFYTSLLLIPIIIFLFSAKNKNPIDNVNIPEPSSKIIQKKNFFKKNKIATSPNFMAVTANHYATEAAYKVLSAGGSAIDAAVVAQLILGLVEPQSSGLGGGGFMLYWDASSKNLYSYDGRETAPQSVDESLFIDPETKKTLAFFDAVVGGKSVGVPGLLKMLEDAHLQHGKFSWQELFLPAIDLSENGFIVSERLHTLLKKVPKLKERPTIKEYFFNDEGDALEVGSINKNQKYSDTLKLLSKFGSDYFYKGKLAKNIIKVVSEDQNSGSLTIQDFEEYEVKVREPICQFIFSYKICGMSAPSSGGSSVLSILKMLEFLITEHSMKPGTKIEEDLLLAHFFIESSRLAFSDRNTFVADPDFVDVPLIDMLDEKYLKSRAKLINKKNILTDVRPGHFYSSKKNPVSTSSPEDTSTTHMSIVDAYGNIVSLTSSIETAFGSRLMVDGFLLNNQLTDFSFNPLHESDHLIFNRVEGGKRPRSSMSPMIVFNLDDEPVMVLGSPGGKRIIPYVAGFILDVLIMGREAQESLFRTHILQVDDRVEVEFGAPKNLVDELQSIGHDPVLRDQTSGLHIIQYDNNKLIGLADPRREGTAKGG